MNDIVIVLLAIIIVLQLLIFVKKSKPSKNIDISEILNQLNRENNTNNTVVSEQLRNVESSMQQASIRSDNQLQKISSHFSEQEKKRELEERKRSEDLEKKLKQILAMDENITNLDQKVNQLSTILGDKKSRGSYGEIQLYQIVDKFYGPNSGISNHQYQLSNNTIVDLAIDVVAFDKMLCVDSKFPLENYLNFENSGEEKFLKLFERDVKRHIDAISSKYLIIGETMNFAFMFIASEGIYMEMQANTGLVDYAFTKNVFFLSPTTIVPVLAMLDDIIVDYKRTKRVDEIEFELDKLAIEFDRFEKRYSNLSKHSIQVLKDIEELNITANKLQKRFNKIKNVDVEEV